MSYEEEDTCHMRRRLVVNQSTMFRCCVLVQANLAFALLWRGREAKRLFANASMPHHYMVCMGQDLRCIGYLAVEPTRVVGREISVIEEHKPIQRLVEAFHERQNLQLRVNFSTIHTSARSSNTGTYSLLSPSIREQQQERERKANLPQTCHCRPARKRQHGSPQTP
jgi:hypothetical protein